jgi:hypothetical protein
MTDYIKEKLIKSILEADLIIEEINNKDWNKKIIFTFIIIILFFSFFSLLIKYISKSSIDKKDFE